MNDREIDNIKVRLYKEFYEANKTLHKRHPSEYYSLQAKYVENGVRKEIDKRKNGGLDEKI